MEKKEPSYTAGGTANWYSHYGKQYGVYIMEYYSAIRRDEILPFETTWMDLEIIMLSEISQI